MGKLKLVEDIYWEARKRGGQRAQLDFTFVTEDLLASFAATAGDVESLNARGPFFPEGTRKPLFVLAQARAATIDIADTEHVQRTISLRLLPELNAGIDDHDRLLEARPLDPADWGHGSASEPE